MNTTRRYIFLILFAVIILHYLLTITHEDYGHATSLSKLVSHWKEQDALPEPDLNDPAALDLDAYIPQPVESEEDDVDEGEIPDEVGQHEHQGEEEKGKAGGDGKTETEAAVATPQDDGRRANATFVFLTRNEDVEGVVKSIQEIQSRFNSHYNYPFVFLNDKPFEDRFKEQVWKATHAKVEFGLIPKEHWEQPEWIDEERATAAREKLVQEGVVYGGSVPYRNMCRFNSGFFYRHELLQKYRWYWRIEPNVHFHCNINFDPFLYMEDNDKIYSFTLTVYEIPQTIPTLWDEVKKFSEAYRHLIAPDNSLSFISTTGGETYNRCHFWSNFEIADMDFWRSPAYTAFFEHLDKAGGFYYERWGDAPIHSIAISLLAKRTQIHFFDAIGYQHDSWTHCPLDERTWEQGKCTCEREKAFDNNKDSCKPIWDRFMNERS